MGDEWDAFGLGGGDDDDFPPAPEDVFGKNVEDVDVWGGHDSFDGAKEWFDFDNEEDDDGFGQSPDNFDGDDDDNDDDSASDGPEPERRKSRPASRSGSHREGRGRSDRSHSGDRSRDHDRKGRSSGRSRSKSRDRSTDGSGHRSRSKSKDRSSDGGHSRDADGDLKRGRRPKPLKNDPTRSRSGGIRSSTDDNLASSYRSANRRMSANSVSTNRDGSRKTLVRRRDGTVSRPRPSEHSSRLSRSDSRRDEVRSALFGAIGEDEPKNEVSLGAFLKHDDKPPSKTSDARSVRSAPAAVHNSSGSRRSSTSSGHHHRHRHHDGNSPTGRGRNRRTGKKPSSPRRESPKQNIPKELIKDGVKLDLAQLAEAGYIEVQDGKMRLVIDMES